MSGMFNYILDFSFSRTFINSSIIVRDDKRPSANGVRINEEIYVSELGYDERIMLKKVGNIYESLINNSTKPLF